MPAQPEIRPTSNRFWLPLLAIVLFAAFLRLYALDSYPQFFHQDEAALGYDAWSIWNTGKDQHGAPWPIHFRTYNDAVPPVANYLTAPFVGLLGLNEYTTRLPFALLGVATIFLVALLGRRWFSPLAGLAAALFLTIDPWHLNYSRMAFPASVAPFFTALALYAFTRALAILNQQSSGPRSTRSAFGWLALSALAFGLLTDAYPPLKLQGPLLLGICLLAAARILWKHRWLALGWLVLYGLVVAPVALDQLLRWEQTQTRYAQLTILSTPGWPFYFLLQYKDHYNPLALFFKGYIGGEAVRPDGIGELFWLEGFFWLIALLALWQRRGAWQKSLGFRLPLLLVLWFLTFPIASSLTSEDVPHRIRSYNFLPLPELLAGYGLAILLPALLKYRPVWVGRAMLGLFAAIFLLFNFIFLSAFFSAPLLETATPPSQMPYNLGLKSVLDKVTQRATACDQIWLEPAPQQTYIYYLFLTRYPPAQYQQANVVKNTNPYGFLDIPRIEQVYFGFPQSDAAQTPACQGQSAHTYFLTRHDPPGPDWQEIARIKNKAGQPVWRALIRSS